VAELLNQEDLPGVPDPLGSSSLAALRTGGGQNDTSRVLASTFAFGEKQLCQNRNLMSVLFNHACRYELFDRNPIHLVRQSAKRRRAPTVLVPAEIKALVDRLSIRERTLVLLAVSTGLRQSELFGLKWGDIDFAQGTMNVTRSIVRSPRPLKWSNHY
jgi:site-specific recombinase XerD